MRILCLHGVGSSGAILRSQLRPFIKAADPSYDFIFVDGPVASDRGPGMESFPEGSFYSHTEGYQPRNMVAAVEHLDSVLEEAGPFDGVLGFSQGAAVTLSYLHLQQTLEKPMPIKFALCFSSVLPCSADPDFGQSLIQRICPLILPVTDSAVSDAETKPSDQTRFKEFLQRTVIPAQQNKAMLPDFDIAVYATDDVSEAPRLMHPGLSNIKIRIPTVHITGKKDAEFMRNMSEAARGICDEKSMKKLEHSGGHQPPQKDAEVKAAIRAMDWAISRSC